MSNHYAKAENPKTKETTYLKVNHKNKILKIMNDPMAIRTVDCEYCKQPIVVHGDLTVVRFHKECRKKGKRWSKVQEKIAKKISTTESK